MKHYLLPALLMCAGLSVAGPATSAPATVTGRVTAAGEPVPFASVRVSGTTTGAAADMEGIYRIEGLPADTFSLVATAVGFRPAVRSVTLDPGQHLVVDFQLEEAILEEGDVVVTATRSERVRREVPVIVNVLDNRVFESTQAVSLSEGLSFQPGLRLEVDCQTCNYTQVRMNGLAGSYSQILIDSRPIFSSLNGLYGLDQIPTSMIERVEVIRGGGSALFGASAVAGTINIITKEPRRDASAISYQQSSVGGSAPDRALSAQTSLIRDDRTAGIFLFGLFRDRQPYDHDGDTFSEIPFMRNNSFGLRGFYRPSPSAKLTVEAHSLTEERQGGNHIGRAPHHADQGEHRLHNVLGGGVTYEQYLPGRTNKIAAYASGQYTGRDHYTGIDHVDAYGNTENFTLVGGLQYSHTLPRFLGTPMNTVTTGVEATLDDVRDEIPFYDRYLDQRTRQAGFYAQSDWKLAPRLVLLLGGRMDLHSRLESPALNPRANVLFNLTSDLQWRGTYATGFRAPQAFDADLHIAFAGGGISRIVIDPDLAPETSRSLSTSLDYNRNHGAWMYGFSLEGFHTRLFETFVLEEVGEDDLGNLVMERRNGGHSTVVGLTGEARYVWGDRLELLSGLTVQRSRYDSPVAWSADVPATRSYLRTPDVYGFYTITTSPWEAVDVSISGVYTGAMEVPHLAGYIDHDVLERTPSFLETNIKIAYTLFGTNMPALRLFGGLHNLTNAYQRDFDQGPYRDSNYVYGPARPRTIYMGIKLEI